MWCGRKSVGGLCLLLSGGWISAWAVDIAVVEGGGASHARRVGSALDSGDEGTIQSMSPYSSADWLTDGFLHAGDPAQEPEIEDHDIQNHSWIGQVGPGGSLALVLDALHRLDHVIVRDGFSAVVSLDNSSTAEVPELLAHAYNVITVGRLDGEHSRGGTWLDGIGRSKPDLVGVMPATSLNVPAVSAAAALLVDAAESGDGLYAARRPEAVKAILLASANKTVLSTWSPEAGEVLDPVYGAGVLDADAALSVLRAGAQTGEIAPRGWDVDWTSSHPARYRLQVPLHTRIEEVSVALAWNREVLDTDPGPGFRAQVSLADLNLALYRESPDGRRQAVQRSLGRVGNVEYLYQARLRPGSYILEVTGPGGVPYALAWNSRTPPPDPF